MVEQAVGTDVAQLVAEHHQAVYRYAYRLCGVVPDAEDLTQQVFLAAQRNVGQLRQAASARSWLFAILRHCFLRGCRRRQPVAASSLPLNIDGIPAEVPSDGEIDRQRLQEALNELPEMFRLVLLMYYFEDCSYREIAKKLDLPIGTVMSRLARAKGHLRSKLFEPACPVARHEQPSLPQRG
jgi:RNA polymerase sigma-70 factor (ECF subfamily)